MVILLHIAIIWQLDDDGEGEERQLIDLRLALPQVKTVSAQNHNASNLCHPHHHYVGVRLPIQQQGELPLSLTDRLRKYSTSIKALTNITHWHE